VCRIPGAVQSGRRVTLPRPHRRYHLPNRDPATPYRRALGRRHHPRAHLGGLAVPVDDHRRLLAPIVGWHGGSVVHRTRLTARHMALARRRPSDTLMHTPTAAAKHNLSGIHESARNPRVRSSLRRPGGGQHNRSRRASSSTLKLDLLYRRTLPNRVAPKSAVFEYIEGFCTRERRHTTLGNLSPADYESAHSSVLSA
jgi:hypothetical protein